MLISDWDRPKLTLLKAFVDWHVNFMGDGLLTVLFCLFCVAIAGLLPSILAFGGHGSLVQEREEKEIEEEQTAGAIEKMVGDNGWKNNELQSGEGFLDL